MTDPRYYRLLKRLADRLDSTVTVTDQDLIARWRTVTLAQHLASSQPTPAPPLTVEALELFASDGPSPDARYALQRANTALASQDHSVVQSVLPQLAPGVRSAVLDRLRQYQAEDRSLIPRALTCLPSLRTRLRHLKRGALSAGIQHRLNLVAELATDTDRTEGERRLAASAVLYFQEIHDVLPDTLGHIGLLDDDFALRTVLEEMDAGPSTAHLHWAERVCALWSDLPFLQGLQLTRDGIPVSVTWLERVSSYVSYSSSISGCTAPIAFVHPSIACEPLHTLISLMGLTVLDRITSQTQGVDALEESSKYLIDGRYCVEYGGISRRDPIGWLRLRFDDGVTYRPPSIAHRMQRTEEMLLSPLRKFPPVPQTERDPAQLFFGWPEPIGISTVPSRVLFVSSRERATTLFGGLESNGIPLLDDSLVRFLGAASSVDDARSALVLVVPTLTAAREFVESGVNACCVFVDGFDRLSRGRYEIPFLTARTTPPPILTWSVKGYVPDRAPAWMSSHRRLTLPTDDIVDILELDDHVADPGTLLRESLWEAATNNDIQRFVIPRDERENRAVRRLESFLESIVSSEDLPDYRKYHLVSRAVTLRALIVATPATWDDIRTYAGDFRDELSEHHSELTTTGQQRLRWITDSMDEICGAMTHTPTVWNSKTDALLALLDEQPSSRWNVVVDRAEQVNALSRVSSQAGVTVKPSLLKDIGVCQHCIAVGWQSRAFAARLRAHTPTRLVALTSDGEWRKWQDFQSREDRIHGESLLQFVGKREATHQTAVYQESDLDVDEKLERQIEQTSGKTSEAVIPCIFLWLVGMGRAKVLDAKDRVLVEGEGQNREIVATDVSGDERVLLGVGTRRWSPSDEFTESVLSVVKAHHPDIARATREWRVSLAKACASQNWTIEQLQSRLDAVGIHRELATLRGWLRLNRAAPIAPQRFKSELPRLWPILAAQSALDVADVIKACEYVHHAHRAARNSLLTSELEQGDVTGIDERTVVALTKGVRATMRVYSIEAVSNGRVPRSMIGWWVGPELATRFETLGASSQGTRAQ